MAEKQAQISSEAAQAPKVQSTPTVERQSPEHLDGAWGDARAQVQRAMSAVGGAASQQNPPSSFDSALGHLGGSSMMRAELVMQLQRRYGNSVMSRLIQRKASGEKVASESEERRFAARKKEDGRDAEGASRALPEGFASTLDGSAQGAPLDLSTRLFMESRFGQSFADVRVHSDASAAEAARRVSAQAFTAGRDIYFGRELYRPETRDGQQLLAHELTHVVQQRTGRATTNDSPAPALSLPEDGFEQEAERAASHVVAGGSFVVSQQPAGASVASRSIIARQEKKTDDATNTAVGRTGESGTSEAVPTDNQSPAGKMDTDRLARIEAIHAKPWVDNDDEVELEQIWESFGSSLPAVAHHNSALWEASVNYGADLYDIPTVVKLRKEFAEDVREMARQYLYVNREYVRDEMARLGLTEGEEGTAEEPTAEQDLYLQEVQQAADKIEDAHQKRRQLFSIQVGYGHNMTLEIGKNPPMNFFPNYKPPKPPTGDEDPPLATWDEVKEQYDALTSVINGLASRYPTLYALTREDSVSGILSNDPEQARKVVEAVLKEVLANIDETFVKLVPDGDIDYYDLVPIQEQLFGGGGAPSGMPWGRDFYKKVAKKDLEAHDSREFWKTLGLSTLAAAAFIVAEIATLGSATFFIAAGTGAVAGGAQVAKSWGHYLDLSLASKTNVTEETALVSSGQASAALTDAILNTAAFFIDLYAPFAKGMRGAGKVVAHGAEAAAEQAAETAAKREALSEAKKEVLEMAAGEVAERKGVNDLSRATAEAVEGAGSVGAKKLTKTVRELFTEVIERIKAWARKAYEAFGFKSYVVEIEGNKMVLYGIRSKVKLLECDVKYLNEFTFENKGQLGDKVLAREEFLELARTATKKAMRNAYRRSAIELSEDIGEIVGERALRKQLKLAGAGGLKRLHRGSGSGTLDLIYRLPDGSIAIVEAKGGAGRIGTRLIEKGVRSEQGTWEYLESILISMGEKPGQSKVANEVWEALEAGKVKYYLTETPIKEGAETVTTKLSEFNYDF